MARRAVTSFCDLIDQAGEGNEDYNQLKQLIINNYTHIDHPLPKRTGGEKCHPLYVGGQTAYRYWQRPVPRGTGFILSDLSYIVKPTLIVQAYLLRQLKPYMGENGLTLRNVLLKLDKMKTIQYPGSHTPRLLNP